MIGFTRLIVIFSLLCVANARSEKNKTAKNGTEKRKTVKNEIATLIFAHVIFRHGDRNPTSSYPTDPYKDESNWAGGFGQLTNIGIEQGYELGKHLRERYRKLLGNGSYSDQLVYVESTDYDRTLNSAAAVLAGLFPPTDDQVWNEALLWHPIPIHTTPLNHEQLLFPGKPCPRLNYAINDYLSSPEIKELHETHKQLFQYLEENTGMPIRDSTYVGHLYDILWIEELKNKTLPEWTKSVYGPGTYFEQIGLRNFLIYTATPEMARLSTGFLIRDILRRCAWKANKSLLPDRSLWLFSAHDTIIANILNALGVYTLHKPSYGSSLHFELYKLKKQHYLQLSYRNSTGETIIDLPYCGTKCSIKEFKLIYKDIIPTGEYDEECCLPCREGFDFDRDEYIIPFVGAFLLLIIIVPLIIYSQKTRNKRMRQYRF